MNLKKLSAAALGVALAAGSMTLAGPAAATVITSNGAPYTGTIAGTSEGHAPIIWLPGAIGESVKCSSSFESKAVLHGSSVTAEVVLGKFSVPACTGEQHVVHMKKPGSLIIHSLGSGNGTVTWSGAEIEMTRVWTGGSYTCVYAINEVDFGVLTGTATTGGSATLHLKALFPRTGGSFLCGSSLLWEGSYVLKTPAFLNVE